MSQREVVDISFSGQFSYHLPVDDNFSSRLSRHEAEARKLLGLSLTPELLWELSPYSWLVDWFLGIGNVVSNITLLSRDQLAINYAYTMLHRRNTSELVNEVSFNGVNPRTSSTFERKMRVKASPYAIRVDADGLSALQLAILAALGISRTPRALLK